jgi:hypothetical protein
MILDPSVGETGSLVLIGISPMISDHKNAPLNSL